MAISLVSTKCPECGADLSVESGREFSFCSYCGTKLMLNNENEHIYRNIDEARIREAETERMIRLRELELEERESIRERERMRAVYGIGLFIVVLSALVSVFNGGAGVFLITVIIYIGFLTRGRKEKKKKRTDDVSNSKWMN